MHPLKQCNVFQLVTVWHYLAAHIVYLVPSITKPRSHPHLNQKSKLSVKPVIISLIYNLDVPLVLQLFQLFSLHAHQSCPFVSVKVNENCFR